MSLQRFDIDCYQRGVVEIAGRVTVDGSGDVSATYGDGFSVAHTTGGTYTITFNDYYQDFISGDTTLHPAAGTDKTAQFGAYTSSSKTLVIWIYDNSTPGLADPANGSSISFAVKMQYTGV